MKAGCSRVTHPSATRSGEQAPLPPFDLHVLGTPPAFVLSQDQTLLKYCIKTSADVLTIFRALIAHSHTACFAALFRARLLVSSSSTSQMITGSFFKHLVCCCLIFKVLCAFWNVPFCSAYIAYQIPIVMSTLFFKIFHFFVEEEFPLFLHIIL